MGSGRIVLETGCPAVLTSGRPACLTSAQPVADCSANHQFAESVPVASAECFAGGWPLADQPTAALASVADRRHSVRNG